MRGRGLEGVQCIRQIVAHSLWRYACSFLATRGRRSKGYVACCNASCNVGHSPGNTSKLAYQQATCSVRIPGRIEQPVNPASRTMTLLLSGRNWLSRISSTGKAGLTPATAGPIAGWLRAGNWMASACQKRPRHDPRVTFLLCARQAPRRAAKQVRGFGGTACIRFGRTMFAHSAAHCGGRKQANHRRRRVGRCPCARLIDRCCTGAMN